MRPRTTIILIILAIGLFVYIRVFDSKRLSTREAVEREQYVVTIDRDRIDGMIIINNEGEIKLQKRDNQWYLESPIKDSADSEVIDQILASLESMKKVNTIEVSEKEDKKGLIKDFDLKKSKVRLKLIGSEAPPEILFGKDTAFEGKIYIRLANSNKIYIVDNNLRNQILKKADEFRDHKLIDLTNQQFNKIIIKNDSGEIELQKEEEHWKLNKPLQARGDSQKISDLIAQTGNTRIDAFISDNTNLNTYGLTEPRGSVSFFSGEKTAPFILQIGQPTEKDKEKVYARLTSRNSIYILPKKIEDILIVNPNELRDKHLLRLNIDIVDRIHIESPAKKKITLARDDENWIIKSQKDIPANSVELIKLMNDLQNQQVTAFIADVASELAKYGLDKPVLKVTFSSYASENTAESKAGDNPILTLSFGKIEGDNVYARLENEPFIVSVNKSILNSIFTDLAQWQKPEAPATPSPGGNAPAPSPAIQK